MIKKIQTPRINIESYASRSMIQKLQDLMSTKLASFESPKTESPNDLSTIRKRLLLNSPTIIFTPSLPESKMLGCYSPLGNVIMIHEQFLDVNLEEILKNVFIHELGHYVCHTLFNDNEHDATFRDVCHRLGIAPGFEKAKISLNIQKRASMAAKTEKLLALSSSPFQAEAEAAFTKAQQIMEEFSISRKNDESLLYYIDVVKNCGRYSIEEKVLSNVISITTGVFCILVHEERGRTLRFYGSIEQVEFALYLWNYVADMISSIYTSKYGKRSRANLSDFSYGFVYALYSKVAYSSCTAITKSATDNKNLYKEITAEHITSHKNHSRRSTNGSFYLGCDQGRTSALPTSAPGQADGGMKALA